jgi:serine/threonine-protein kinase
MRQTCPTAPARATADPDAMPSPPNIAEYVIVRELGEGAMGIVYEARHRVTGRRVAIKTVQAEFLSERGDDSALARFRREAETGQRLHHPNIVSVYDYGDQGQQAYIVMELVEGQQLNRMLRQRGRFAWGEAQFIMQQLLDALDHSHRRGVVHRDIKPANIMVMSDLMIKVMDFGIARVQSSQITQVGTLLGTPTHMAPEQLAGDVADARADLWGAGVLCYELLTGGNPFAGKTSAAVMHAVIQLEPAPVSSVVPGVPSGMDGVLQKALAKRRERRFQSASEFLRALDDASLTLPSGAAELDLELAPDTSVVDFDPDSTVVVKPGGD